MVSSPIRTQPAGLAESSLSLVESAQLPKSTNVSAAWNPIVLPATPLFGTDGIRGRAGELLCASLALQVGFWAGLVLRANATNHGPVILGQDSRNSSDMLAIALSAGLTEAGLEVWNLGLCPTPCVAHLVSVTDAVGGIMISASHNPPEDNGIKFFGHDGMKLPAVLQQEIEAGLRGYKSGKAYQAANSSHSHPPKIKEGKGGEAIAPAWGKHYDRRELVENYGSSLGRSLSSGIDLRGMRIVLDLAWGAASRVAPAVFKARGAEVICLHDQPDGSRINVNCGSTHLRPLQQAVQQHGAELGFAFDGDADRVMAVDALGRVVDGDYILYFWGENLRQLNQLPGDLIVATVMANLGFERAWKQLGGQMIRTPVGDQHVQAEMLRTGAMLGGEQSGHILCHHYSVSGDGLLTALHLAALVRQSGATLAEMVDRSFVTYPQLLQNVRVEDRERRVNWQQCAAVQNAIARAETAMGEDGRVLVRASGTEPVIRVMVEAKSAPLVQHWTGQLVGTIQQHLA